VIVRPVELGRPGCDCRSILATRRPEARPKTFRKAIARGMPPCFDRICTDCFSVLSALWRSHRPPFSGIHSSKAVVLLWRPSFAAQFSHGTTIFPSPSARALLFLTGSHSVSRNLGKPSDLMTREKT
jgi:hypothetical protein